ncbi:MAG: ComEC/Rec2 family competence protein [Bacillales bacterium]|nr:ComEC/Rec2 family competence protein [Bacillales bacterium]
MFVIPAIYIFLKCHTKKTLIVGVTLFLVSFLGVFLARFNLSNKSYIGVVVYSKDNYIILKSFCSFYYIPIKDNQFEVFDLIKVTGSLSSYNFLSYESDFNFNSFLSSKLVYYQLVPNQIVSIFKTPFKTRMFTNSILSSYSDYSKIVVGKLIFNFSTDDEYNNLISSNSLFYLLSISSLHVYFINNILFKLVNIKLSDKNSSIFIIFFTSIIYIFSSYKSSILKVLLFYIVNYISDNKLKEKLSFIARISIVGIIMIILDPSYVFSQGFIYSFSLPYFLYYLNDIVSMYQKKKQKYIRLIYIFLFTIPINIYINYELSLFSYPITFLLSPFVLVIYVFSLISIFIPSHIIIDRLSFILLKIIGLIDKINLKITIGEVGIIFIIIYYFLLLHLIFSVENRMRFLHVKSSLSIIILLFIAILPIKNSITNQVSFINVGQGDCALIRLRNTSILVDTGGNKSKDIATCSLIPYFKKERIRKIDYVFITHHDFDHYGALDSLKKNYSVKNIIDDNSFTCYTIKNIDFINLNPRLTNDENIDSLVLYFSINNKSFLLMGDAPISVEKKIISSYEGLQVDYLKVGHHGSNTSSSLLFLQTIKPKEAIISCGANNYYHHPNTEVIDNLKRCNIKIRRTDLEGTITYFV